MPASDPFKKAMKFVLRWEGGYVNHPNDPGGATNKGVTQNVFDAWLESRGELPRDVKTITDEDVYAIYKERYWAWAQCERLTMHEGLAMVHFDTAVNMGVRRATLILQESVGTIVDGDWGPNTQKAIELAATSDVLTNYCDIRERVYRWLAKNRPKLAVFLRGWLNRLNALRLKIGLPMDLSIEALSHSGENPGSMPMGHLPELDDGEMIEGFPKLEPFL